MKNQLASKFTKANLAVVSEDILPLIKIEFARLAAENLIGKLNVTVDVLLDEDENDQSQLNLIWGNFTSDPQITEAIRLALLDAASKVNDETVKNLLSGLVQPLTETIVALSDSEKQNDEQLKTIWKNFLKSPMFLTLVLENLDVILDSLIKNQKVSNWLQSILKSFIGKN
jgi:hypothetical protein